MLKNPNVCQKNIHNISQAAAWTKQKKCRMDPLINVD